VAFCGRRQKAHRVHAQVMRVAAFIAREKVQSVILAEVTSTVTRGAQPAIGGASLLNSGRRL
jgi:hypothetical protein